MRGSPGQRRKYELVSRARWASTREIIVNEQRTFWMVEMMSPTRESIASRFRFLTTAGPSSSFCTSLFFSSSTRNTPSSRRQLDQTSRSWKGPGKFLHQHQSPFLRNT
jgi:hypothetical protein